MMRNRPVTATLAISILLAPLAACSALTGAKGCDNSPVSGDMLKRLNACETGWVETQRRDDLFAIRTVFKPTSGESCRVWLYPSTGQANRAASYINRTVELRTPAYYHLGRDPFSSLPFIAVSQELGTNCVRAMESALGVHLDTKMQILSKLPSEENQSSSSAFDTESDDSVPESSSAIEDTPAPESTDMNPPIVNEPTPQDPHQDLDNAYGSAAQNIGYQAFSRSGLIDELVSQRYPRSLATKAVDKLNEDWNAQARWKAGYILSINEVSKTELVKQLVAAGFTAAQAAYGADNPSLTKPDH